MKNKPQIQNILFQVSLLFPAIYIIVVLILDIVTPAYNPMRETISMLVHTSNGLYQTLNFIVSGFFITILGLTTNKLQTRNSIKNIVGNVILLFGVSMLILAALPTDTSLIPTTPIGITHFYLFVVILAIFIIVELITSIKTRKSNRVYSNYSLISFIFTSITSLLILLMQNYAGLLEIVVVISIVVWFTISPLVVKRG